MKKVVMTPNPYRDRNFKYANLAENILREAGVETKTCLAFDVDKTFELPEDVVLHDLTEELRDADLLICFGGDGTILHASKAATRAGVPVLGVNIGTMGFMAELESSELKLLSRLAQDDYTVEERMMLHVKAEHEGKVLLEEEALNDAVITKGAVARIIQMTVSCDHMQIMSFGGDGVIVCTPTGSTAYSMSAGGPIVEPEASAIIVSPICAHMMSARSYVLSASHDVSVLAEKLHGRRAYISVDGNSVMDLTNDDLLRVRRSERCILMADMGLKSFYELAYEKLT